MQTSGPRCTARSQLRGPSVADDGCELCAVLGYATCPRCGGPVLPDDVEVDGGHVVETVPAGGLCSYCAGAQALS